MLEIRKLEDPDGKLLNIGFHRTIPDEDLREGINTWMKKNYPEMTLEEFFSRLDYLTNELWVITMEEKRGPG